MHQPDHDAAMSSSSPDRWRELARASRTSQDQGRTVPLSNQQTGSMTTDRSMLVQDSSVKPSMHGIVDLTNTTDTEVVTTQNPGAYP